MAAVAPSPAQPPRERESPIPSYLRSADASVSGIGAKARATFTFRQYANSLCSVSPRFSVVEPACK